MRLRVLQVAQVDDIEQTMTVEMAVGLSWTEPRLLFNNIFDWDVRRSVKVKGSSSSADLNPGFSDQREAGGALVGPQPSLPLHRGHRQDLNLEELGDSHHLQEWHCSL